MDPKSFASEVSTQRPAGDVVTFRARRQTASWATPLVIGQTISHYRIISHIGQGGMGTVYLAEDTSLHRRVALKFIASENPRSSQARHDSCAKPGRRALSITPHRHDLRNRRGHRLSFPSVAC